MAIRKGPDATAWAAHESLQPTKDYTGLCLVFTRNCFNIPAKYASAIEAWEGAGGADGDATHTVVDKNRPPAGVPVFWRGGKYGHVALSAGDGYVWSSDIRRRGKVDRVPIGEIGARWGYKLLGWAEVLNGVRVYKDVN